MKEGEGIDVTAASCSKLCLMVAQELAKEAVAVSFDRPAKLPASYVRDLHFLALRSKGLDDWRCVHADSPLRKAAVPSAGGWWRPGHVDVGRHLQRCPIGHLLDRQRAREAKNLPRLA